MNRWQLSKDWVLVWGFTLLLVGIILYIGYRSSISYISSEGTPRITTNEFAYGLKARTSLNSGRSTVNGISITHLDEQAKNFDPVPEFQKELRLVFGQTNTVAKPLELKDFPSPIDGEPVRNVGNYYLDNFGYYVFHAGVDYILSEGTVIRATRGGKVVFAGPDAFLGQKVTLECGEGWLVTYGGLDNLRVQEGEVVEARGALGQIGFLSGAEGQRGQTQLHYEVWHNGQVQRPL